MFPCKNKCIWLTKKYVTILNKPRMVESQIICFSGLQPGFRFNSQSFLFYYYIFELPLIVRILNFFSHFLSFVGRTPSLLVPVIFIILFLRNVPSIKIRQDWRMQHVSLFLRAFFDPLKHCSVLPKNLLRYSYASSVICITDSVIRYYISRIVKFLPFPPWWPTSPLGFSLSS